MLFRILFIYYSCVFSFCLYGASSKPSDRSSIVDSKVEHNFIEQGTPFARYSVSRLFKCDLDTILSEIYSEQKYHDLWDSDEGLCYVKAECLKDLFLERGFHLGKVFWIPTEGKIVWSYHVANYLFVGPSDDDILILDPYFSKDPMNKTIWIASLAGKTGSSIDSKSIQYKSPKILAYDVDTGNLLGSSIVKCDWREEIFLLEKRKNMRVFHPIEGLKVITK